MSKIRLQRYDKHNAVALLHFDSSLTRDECGNTWSAVGSPTLSSDYHKFGTKSIFVNNENYIQSTDSFTVGGSDLTIEAWIYNLGGQATFFSFGTPDSGLCFCTPRDLDYYTSQWRAAELRIGTDYMTLIDSSLESEDQFNFISRRWEHVAVVYQHDSYLWSVFVNGKTKGSLTQALDAIDFNLLKIGGDYGENSSTGCYIDDFRITNAALYTQKFTPADSPATVNVLAPVLEDIKLYSLKPTEPVELAPSLYAPVVPLQLQKEVITRTHPDQYTKVLMHFDESITKDECGNTWTAYGSPAISTYHAPFDKAAQFDGTIQYLQLNNSITLGGKDFTIDFWLYMDSATPNGYVNGTIFWFGISGTDARIYCHKRGGSYNTLSFGIRTASDSSAIYDHLGLDVNLDNKLSHLAFVYQHSLGAFSGFLNGVKKATVSKQFDPIVCTGNYLFYNEQSAAFSGAIDEFRISDGIARWTEDFTPPTAPYDTIISTQPIDNPVKSHIKIYTDSEKAIAKSKYPCNLAISSDSISLDNSNLSRVVFADFDGTGTLSATSADTSIATVSVSGKNITIVGKGIGSTTITVTVPESADYEGSTAIISVTSDIVPALNQCSPAQIKNIITAGKHTLAWNVGDMTAGINIDNWWLSETSGVTKYVNGTYYTKIIGFNHNKEVETAGKDSIHFALGSTSTGTDIAFITTQFYNKEISSSGYAHLAHSISSTATSGTTTVKNTNSGGWASSKIRTLSLSDSNSTKSLLNRLPTEWTSVMASVTKYTDNTGQKSTSEANVTATADKLFIPAHYEVFGANLDTDGTTHLVNTYEYDKTVNGNKVQVQYDYFKTNRVRYKHTATSTACIWWLRSPSAKGSITYRDVKANGDFYGANASCSLGVVPCFAIAAA